MGPILGFIVWLVVAAVVLLIVDRLNLGIKVGNFTNAALAAIVIAIVAAVVEWFLGPLLGLALPGGFLGAIVALLVAAVVLYFAARIFKGMTVDGFKGAFIGAIGIAVVGWVLNWLVGLIF